MRKMHKTSLAAAVSLAIGGMATAHAQGPLTQSPDSSITQVLFPIVSTSDAGSGTITLLSLVNDNGGFESHNDVKYRITYIWKGTVAGQTDACFEKDFTVDVTENFLLQYDIAREIPLAALNLSQDEIDALDGQLDPFPDNSNGFAIVEVVDGPAGFVDPRDVSLFGEAAIVNQGAGLRWAYSTRDLGLPFRGGSQASFAELEGTEKVTSWYAETAPTLIGTVWHALPLGTRDEMAEAGVTQGPGGANVGLNMTVQAETLTGEDNRGAFRRNEDFNSGSIPKDIRCFAFFGARELLGEFNFESQFIDGGWMSVAGYQGQGSAPSSPEGGDQHYMLHKIQFRAVGPNGPDPVFINGNVTDTVITREAERVFPTVIVDP